MIHTSIISNLPLHLGQDMFQSFWEQEPTNCGRGFKLAAFGASCGCPHNKAVLGCCFLFGRGTAKDKVRGFELARESSAAGSRFGHYLLGLCYEAGWGAAHDRDMALESFRLDLGVDDSDVTSEESDDWMEESDGEDEEDEDSEGEEEEEEEAGFISRRTMT